MSEYFTVAALSGYAFIFFARICDVSLQTMRTIMVVRGERLKAATLGFFEVTIYVVALGSIFDNLDNPFNVLVYALGFASGNYIGGMIEEKLAIGVQFVQIITMNDPLRFARNLREQGYGVTAIEGHGFTGSQFVLQVLADRKKVKTLLADVDAWDQDNFVIVTDARKYHGGIMSRDKRSFANGMWRKGK
jgi:uncharacterized protein YebE (UPF0316 family)